MEVVVVGAPLHIDLRASVSRRRRDTATCRRPRRYPTWAAAAATPRGSATVCRLATLLFATQLERVRWVLHRRPPRRSGYSPLLFRARPHLGPTLPPPNRYPIPQAARQLAVLCVERRLPASVLRGLSPLGCALAACAMSTRDDLEACLPLLQLPRCSIV